MSTDKAHKRPKDSRHSNRYKGNALMIEKIFACSDRLGASRPRTPEQERIARIDAQFKRERKAQRRLAKGQGRKP